MFKFRFSLFHVFSLTSKSRNISSRLSSSEFCPNQSMFCSFSNLVISSPATKPIRFSLFFFNFRHLSPIMVYLWATRIQQFSSFASEWPKLTLSFTAYHLWYKSILSPAKLKSLLASIRSYKDNDSFLGLPIHMCKSFSVICCGSKSAPNGLNIF